MWRSLSLSSIHSLNIFNFFPPPSKIPHTLPPSTLISSISNLIHPESSSRTLGMELEHLRLCNRMLLFSMSFCLLNPISTCVQVPARDFASQVEERYGGRAQMSGSAAVRKQLRLLWQPCNAGSMLQMLSWLAAQRAAVFQREASLYSNPRLFLFLRCISFLSDLVTFLSASLNSFSSHRREEPGGAWGSEGGGADTAADTEPLFDL